MVTLNVRFSNDDCGTIWLEFKPQYGNDQKDTYKFHEKCLQVSN